MMKRVFSLGSLAIATALLFGVVATSCSKSSPKEPEDERKHKHHEEPVRAVIKLDAVVLTSPTDFKTASTIAYSNSTSSEPSQTIEMQSTDKGWAITSATKQFNVVDTSREVNKAYILNIEYYAEDGDLMNSQFVDGGQDKIHQHVFAYHKDKVQVRRAEDMPWEYRYCDSKSNTPGSLKTSDDNPIGFKGIIRFVKDTPQELNMEIQLLHAYDSKYLKDGKTASPYYAIDPSKSTHGRDVNLDIPLRIAR